MNSVYKVKHFFDTLLVQKVRKQENALSSLVLILLNDSNLEGPRKPEGTGIEWGHPASSLS
jgi:hypothetical protein